VYAQCVQLGMPRSRFIPLEGRRMNCLHGLPLQVFDNGFLSQERMLEL
jgi:hypothetical protein